MTKNQNISLTSSAPVAIVAPSPLLDLLRRAADAEQLRLQPLPAHAASEEEEHLRQHYALLLAALLTAQPQVSETQSRLFMLLLDALQLGDKRAPLFEQARELAPDTLLEAARLIREQGYAQELLVDALVLLRLDAPLSDETAQLLGELAAFLGLTDDTVKLRSLDAAQILGLGENSNELLAKNWPASIPYALTKEDLQEGLKGGIWYLDQDLAVNFHWQAENAMLIFAPGVTLNTAAPDGATILQSCHLQGAGLVFTGAGSLTLDNCEWQGDYAVPRIALESQGIGVTVNSCLFSTRNANTLTVNQADLMIHSCEFIACGAAQYAAGAIVHSDNHREIMDCRFEECVGSHAGALHFHALYGIKNCEFIACGSFTDNAGNAPAQNPPTAELAGSLSSILSAISNSSNVNRDVTDLAVYTGNHARGGQVVTACVFRQCSLSIGSANVGSRTTFVTNSQFHNGNLYFHRKDTSNVVQSGCTFSGGQVIEKNF